MLGRWQSLIPPPRKVFSLPIVYFADNAAHVTDFPCLNGGKVGLNTAHDVRAVLGGDSLVVAKGRQGLESPEGPLGEVPGVELELLPGLPAVAIFDGVLIFLRHILEEGRPVEA